MLNAQIQNFSYKKCWYECLESFDFKRLMLSSDDKRWAFKYSSTK